MNIAVWVAVWPTLQELARKMRAGEIDPKGVFASLREGHPSMNREEG